MIRLRGDTMTCPVCGAADEIYEEDRATRSNPLRACGGAVEGTLGSHDFEHHRYFCGACGATVTLPDGVEIEYP